MNRNRALCLLLAGWWLGVVFDDLTGNLDLGWWDTVFLFATALFTGWIMMSLSQADDDTSRQTK